MPTEEYLHVDLNIDELAAAAGLPLTSASVIRFQQHGEKDFAGSNTIDVFFTGNFWLGHLTAINDEENSNRFF